MERITRVRVTILLALFCVILGFFTLRLFNLQVVANDGDTDNRKLYYTVTRVKAARGDILDCNGNVLVTNRATYDLVFNHYVIKDATGTNNYLLQLVQLCRELGVEYIDHFPVSEDAPFTYTLSDYSSTWQGYFQAYLPTVGGGLDSDITAPLLMRKLRDAYSIPEDWSDEDARAVIGLRYELDLRSDITNLSNYVFMEDVDNDTLAAILELNIPGLKTEESMVRVYNTEYAAHVLGYIGAITEEQWAETYKELDGYSMDALVGQSGFELAFEEYLHGVDGYRVDVTTSDGTLVEQYYRTDEDGNEQVPVAGQNVEVSIDINLQGVAEEEMATLFAQLRAQDEDEDGADAEGGAVVVMEVKTGQVLVCASYPTYDLANFREIYSELLEQDYAPMYNRATQATYPPGSTYKMSMVIAGIDSGVITQYTTIEDEGVFTKYEGFTANCLYWTNYGLTHGSITAAQALSVSCNYFFYELGDMVSLEAMDATAKALGLGESTGIELAENIGYRANAETKASLYSGDDARWYRADQIMAAIGQSINRFTPMQLCVYTSTLANRGVRYKATFLSRVLSSGYESLVYTNEPVIVSTLEISDAAYQAYSEGMRLAATEGTARGSLGDFAIAVAAKTGTAETYSSVSDNGAFVCYAPYDDPEIAIVVYGEKAGHGTTMGQIARAILEAYFSDELSGSTSTGENSVS
ncbi:MAG: hypothetical protein LUJ09_00030 [Firmicutes bacterium]|nr:hypothetical protein [Bacillota bacterium]